MTDHPVYNPAAAPFADDSQRDHLPRSIRVERTPDGVRYVLPRRRAPLGPLLFSIGLMALGLGLVVAGMYVSGAVGMHSSGWWFAAWIAGGGVMIALGLVLTWWGAYPNLARDTMTVNEQWVWATTHLGLLAWSRRVARRDMTLVRLVRVTFRSRTTGLYKRMLDATGWYIGVETAQHEGDDPVRTRLVTWYPFAILDPLADELAQVLSVARHDAIDYLDVDPEAAMDPGPETAPVKPAWSDIKEARDGDAVTIIVPPSPVLRGGSGRSTVGMLVRVVSGAIVGMAIVALIFGNGISSAWTWMGMLFGVPAMRGWFALLGERFGRRETYFDVLDGTLLVSRKRYLDVVQHEWDRSEIIDVRCDASDIKIGDELLPQLQIMARDGQVVGLLTGRDEDELDWLAWRIRAAVGIPSRSMVSRPIAPGPVVSRS